MKLSQNTGFLDTLTLIFFFSILSIWYNIVEKKTRTVNFLLFSLFSHVFYSWNDVIDFKLYQVVIFFSIFFIRLIIYFHGKTNSKTLEKK